MKPPKKKTESVVDPVFGLWKSGDKAWMRQRREEWEIIEKNNLEGFSGREISEIKRFYLKGVVKGYIGGGEIYIYCPFTSPDEARLAFFSSLFGCSERERILSSFVFNGSLWGRDMPWIRCAMRSFSLGVLGKKYSSCHCIDFEGSKIEAPKEDWVCSHFTRCSVELFRGEWSYHGVMECFEYFLSALTSGFVPKKLTRIRVPEMLESADHYLQTGKDEDVLGFARLVVSHRGQLMRQYDCWL